MDLVDHLDVNKNTTTTTSTLIHPIKDWSLITGMGGGGGLQNGKGVKFYP